MGALISFVCAVLGLVVALGVMVKAWNARSRKGLSMPRGDRSVAPPAVGVPGEDVLRTMPVRHKLLGGVGAVLFFAAINLRSYWADHRPRSPDLPAGQVHAISLNGGAHMFVSTADIALALGLAAAGIALMAAALLLARRARRP